MRDLLEKMRLLASVSFVETISAREETFEYSRIGSAIRRIVFRLLKKARPLRKEILFLYQFESRSDRLSRSMDYLSSIRNSHKGERVFVIANGPSLLYSDLDRITDEVAIASN